MLRANYNKLKPTKRQQKKQKQQAAFETMRAFLADKWNHEVKFTCFCCLETAYKSEMQNMAGYITDDDLILSSQGRLKHK